MRSILALAALLAVILSGCGSVPDKAAAAAKFGLTDRFSHHRLSRHRAGGRARQRGRAGRA